MDRQPSESNDLSDSRHSVREDSLEASFERHHRQRTAPAGSDHLKGDRSIFYSEQDDVASVRLDSRADVGKSLLQERQVDGFARRLGARA